MRKSSDVTSSKARLNRGTGWRQSQRIPWRDCSMEACRRIPHVSLAPLWFNVTKRAVYTSYPRPWRMTEVTQTRDLKAKRVHARITRLDRGTWNRFWRWESKHPHARVTGSRNTRVYRSQNALHAHESKSRRTARTETRPRTVAAPRGVTRPPCIVQPVP